MPLVAKLERPEAIDHLDEILAAADGVMVARGDLGLEMPLERVPRLQKEILRKARARGIPVIVATQVLESMRTEPRPTRAEASDAAGAVDGGADAIMLSGETATGLVSGAIGGSARRDHSRCRDHAAARRASAAPRERLSSHATALCEAAVSLASRAGAHAIVAVTREGQYAAAAVGDPAARRHRRRHRQPRGGAAVVPVARRQARWSATSTATSSR